MSSDPVLIERFASTWMSLVMTMFTFATLSGLGVLLIARFLPWCRTGRAREIVLYAGVLPFLIPPAALQLVNSQASSTSYRFTHADGMPPVALALVVLHLAGIVVSLSWLLLQKIRVACVTRAGIPVRSGWLAEEFAKARTSVGATSVTSLRLSHRIRVPCTTGVLSPVVLLPSRLPADVPRDEMRAILVHELEHVRRRDVLADSFLRIISALWWFHPVPRLLAKRLRVVREELCDDAVIRGDRTMVRSYAEALYRVAQWSSIEANKLGVVGIAGDEAGTLVYRILRLARPLNDEGGLWRRVVVAVLASVCLIGAASMTPSLEIDPRGDLRSATSLGGSAHQPGHEHQHSH